MSLAASAGRGAVWSPTHVQVTVLQARGLRAKGPGGTSDAYAVIQVGKEKYATSVSERSLGAPVWREEATFELPPLLSSGAAPAAAATLQLTVLHRALLGLDKFLGRAEVDLRELHQDQGRRRTKWYALKSKPGKKDKERGEIEVDIQFMRHNMTASMFDLSMKDKSRNPFGKLKDKFKGKNKDSASDTTSAIIPSVTPSVDSDDESFSKDKKKKSKIKTLFTKSNLQKTPLSQSMSVLPVSKPEKVLLRPGDFQSRWDDEEEGDDEASSASSVMSHKRTASADPKQLNQVSFTLPKKEGLSFLGGLRSKNDLLSRSNVCINGNHVYVEQPEGKSETKDSSPSSSPSPQGFRKKHLFSSTENLAVRSWKEPGEGGSMSSDGQLSETSTKDSPKSMSLPSYRPLASGDIRENVSPANSEAVKETKDSKKQESKKSSLLSLVTGKKDVAKGSEGESPPAIPWKEKDSMSAETQQKEEDPVRRPEKDACAIASGQGSSLNPFEDVEISELEGSPEPKSEPKPPVPSPRAPQTKAVRPRLEMSPEAPPKAGLPPSPDSPLSFSAPPSSPGPAPVPPELGHGSETLSSESPSVFSSFSSPIAAPLSTSTPIEYRPPPGQGQASSEEAPLLLKADLQKGSLTPVPNTVPSASGSLSRQPPDPASWKGMGGFQGGTTGETGPGKNASACESGRPLLGQPEGGRRGERSRLSSPEAEGTLSAQETHQVPLTLSLSSGGVTGPAGEPPTGGDDRGRGDETPTTEEAAPPLQTGELPPISDATMQRHKAGLSGHEGRTRVKKHVSFSEQLFTGEEVERPTGMGEEDENPPQEGAAPMAAVEEAATADASGYPHTERSEAGHVATAGPWTRGLPAPTGDECSTARASPAEDTLLFMAERDNTPVPQHVGKASGYEGLLSDSPAGFQSASDSESPSMADLNLTLPSIPEVASDDERVDQGKDDRRTAESPTLSVRASSQAASASCPQKAEGPSGGADESESPVAAPSEQTAAPGTPESHLGKSSSVDKQLPDPGPGGEESPEGHGRPVQPPGTSLDSPVPSPSFSETSLSIHLSPSSPHSDTQHLSTAEPHIKATAEGSAAKVDSFGKRKPLLQAWVSPSETHPVSAQPGAGTGAAKHRLHPVKPMSTVATKIVNSSLGTATIISENLINEALMKKYNPSDPAFAYAQLTHDELIQLVLKQKETISKKEFQVRELEDYIDNLLVRVMEETPNILRIPAQVGKKAGKM